MFVAGDHVNNDIAGDWKKELEDNGYKVSVLMEGLGQNPTYRTSSSNMPVLRPNTKWSISWIKRSNTLLEKTDGPNAHYPSQSHK